MKSHLSIYTRFGLWFKEITGIRDISIFRKNVKRKVGRFLFHKQYTVDDLVCMMCDMGMKEGSVVCIHSAMKEFYNFRGTATELIKAILKVLGSEGTLVMPAFPAKNFSNKKGYVFNKETDPTGAGYLAETFRKYPCVKRSINVRHSVCAIGKHADYLIKDHHKCENCFDENSPWYRMCELDALVFNLGLPRSYIGTFHHCVESLLRNKHPYYAQFFTCHTENRYYDESGAIKTYQSIENQIERRARKKKVTKYFTAEDWCIKRISNLEIKVFYSKKALNKMLKLAMKGVTVYYVPNPKKFRF